VMPGAGLGNGGVGNAGWTDCKWDCQRSEASCTRQTSLRCAHIAYQTTRDVVGLHAYYSCGAQ